ncbi:MAG: hypothetical protein PUB18_01385 [bacterium]|nr:hypothetical protein [bacterium]
MDYESTGSYRILENLIFGIIITDLMSDMIGLIEIIKNMML